MLKYIALSLALVAASPAHAEAPQFWNRITPAKEQPKSFFDAALTPRTLAHDESINFQPGLNLYHEAAQLTDLFGTKGSQLCAPVALTHGFTYLKYAVGYGRLSVVPDMDADGTADTYRDKIRYYFDLCQTDKEKGTYYRQAKDCMRRYVEDSGYRSYVWMVGAHAIEAPPDVPLETMQHVVNVQDIRTYVGNGLMVLAGVGWYTYDAATNTYTREGGHFVNVYGYDYSYAWGDNQITLKIVNSWIDYDGRARTEMFDDVTMTKLTLDGTQYPVEVGYELKGPGFNFPQRAFIEDIFVGLPIQ